MNLAISFGLHVLFPAGRPVDWFALGVCLLAFVGLWRWKWNVIPVVIGSAVTGLIYHLVAAGGLT